MYDVRNNESELRNSISFFKNIGNSVMQATSLAKYKGCRRTKHMKKAYIYKAVKY